jgi:general secretion pathway protein H
MTSPAKQRRPAGFTLIELLVVITIMGLALALIAGHGPMRSAGLEENGTAADLAGGLREARADAIAQNKQVVLTVDIATHRWRIDKGAERTIPAQFALSVLTVKGETRGGKLAGIVFEPDGSSTGGQINFDDGMRKFAVNIDWLTGNVRVTKG